MGTRVSSLNEAVCVHPNNNNNNVNSALVQSPLQSNDRNRWSSTRKSRSSIGLNGSNTTSTTRNIFARHLRGSSPRSPTRRLAVRGGGSSDGGSIGDGTTSTIAGTTPPEKPTRLSFGRRSSSRLSSFFEGKSKRAWEAHRSAPGEPEGSSPSASGGSDRLQWNNRIGSAARASSEGRELPEERLEHSTTSRSSGSSVSKMDYRRPATRTTSVGSDSSGQRSFRLRRQPSTYGELHELVAKNKLGKDEIRGLVGEAGQILSHLKIKTKLK